MSRTGFDSLARVHAQTGQHSSSFYNTRQDTQDDRGSVSGSDEGSYTPYHDGNKAELDNEDDYTALTSQTLNSDGTPKRPMNAFMIFARRRRPQVSSENQAMRTGEISKILSKEWNNMEAAEKQFYQEQARQLKDTFNTKYPDYVYRRRPNNSRRKRKADIPGLRPDNRSSGERDDAGFEDTGDSPIDDEFHPQEHISSIRSRPSHEILSSSDHKLRQQHPRGSPYSYPIQDAPRSNAAHDNSYPYGSSMGGDRMIHDNSSGQSPHTSHSYPFLASHGPGRSHSQSQSLSLFNPSSIGANENWNPPSVRQSPWLGPIDSDRFPPLSIPKNHRSPMSPASWQHSSHTPGVSANPIPTLTTPFFPQDGPQNMSPPSYHSSPVEVPQLVNDERPRHQSEFVLSPPLSNPDHSYHSSVGRDGSMYTSRYSGAPRSLPPISSYSQSQNSHLSGSGGSQGYWPRG